MDIVEKTAAFREATVEKVPVNNSDVVNKLYADTLIAVDLEAVTTDIIANIDNTYDLGSDAKKWKNIYAYSAFLTTILVLGGLSLTWDAANNRGIFNGSMFINGSLEAEDNITATFFHGDGSALTGVNGSGDITAVNTNGKYLTGGAASGDANLLVNETELNATITALDTATSDTLWTIKTEDFINNSATLELNWTTINSTSDARDSDTTYTNASFDVAQIPGVVTHNASTNLTLNDNIFLCLGSSGCADSYIVFNTTSLIIKVN